MKNITTFDLKLLQEYDKIYVLVSGGIDSTYLWDLISATYPRAIAVNCWNPYEQSTTLNLIPHMTIFPAEKYNYGEILHEAFKQIPKAIAARKAGKYDKHLFKCCYYIKHKAFLNDPLFKDPTAVVVSGIKKGDGQRRHAWLHQCYLHNTFFHRHRGGQMYCYPFRDYDQRELPAEILTELRVKYPQLTHSGCAICPVLVVFEDLIDEPIRKQRSLEYWYKICGQKKLTEFF